MNVTETRRVPFVERRVNPYRRCAVDRCNRIAEFGHQYCHDCIVMDRELTLWFQRRQEKRQAREERGGYMSMARVAAKRLEAFLLLGALLFCGTVFWLAILKDALPWFQHVFSALPGGN